MEWTPPPNDITMCEGSGVINYSKEEASRIPHECWAEQTHQQSFLQLTG